MGLFLAVVFALANISRNFAASLSDQPITEVGVAHTNDLVARKYLMPYDYACVTFVDRLIELTPSRPILKFQLMMLSMQDLLNDKTLTSYPPLR